MNYSKTTPIYASRKHASHKGQNQVFVHNARINIPYTEGVPGQPLYLPLPMLINGSLDRPKHSPPPPPGAEAPARLILTYICKRLPRGCGAINRASHWLRQRAVKQNFRKGKEILFNVTGAPLPVSLRNTTAERHIPPASTFRTPNTTERTKWRTDRRRNKGGRERFSRIPNNVRNK